MPFFLATSGRLASIVSEKEEWMAAISSADGLPHTSRIFSSWFMVLLPGIKGLPG